MLLVFLLVVIIVLFATVVIVIIIIIITIVIGLVVSCTNSQFYNSSPIHFVTTPSLCLSEIQQELNDNLDISQPLNFV